MSPECTIEGLGPVWVMSNREFSSNSYICSTGVENECFLVDPGLDGDLIREKLDDLKMAPTAIFCTHGHFDHIGSVKRFQDEFGAKSFISRLDLKTAKQSNFLLTAFKMKERIEVPDFEGLMDDGDQIAINGVELQFISCPGHTDGSCVLLIGGVLFTGDTLFSRGVGLSRLPGENTDVLKRSIAMLFEIIDDDVMVLPGHGPSSRLGDIWRNNDKLRAFMRPVNYSV